MLEVNTVVRFHDAQRIPELKRCLFSLVGQSYRPLHIILALQRFSNKEIDETRAAISSIVKEDDSLRLSIVNYELSQPEDARSALLNLGTLTASKEYLAFLDYDDVLYPEAYQLLTSQIARTKAAIVFSSVRVMRLTVYDQYFYAEGRVGAPFGGTDLVDLFKANFCPLHSYMLDRRIVSDSELRFNTSMKIEEDYDMLLRVCAKYRSDFGLIEKFIGDYYYKTDGSNTVATDGGLAGESLAYYMNVKSAIEDRRKNTVISPTVQHMLGLPLTEDALTIQDVVNYFFSGWTSGSRSKPPIAPDPLSSAAAE